MNAATSTTRSSRAIPLLVKDGLDDHLFQTLSSLLSNTRVEVVDSVFEAIHVTGSTPVGRPISSVILSEKMRFEYRDVINAFKIVDPVAQLVLILEDGDPAKVEEARMAGFASAFTLPSQSSELNHLITGTLPDQQDSKRATRTEHAPADQRASREDGSRRRKLIEAERAERALGRSRQLNEERKKLKASDTNPPSTDVSGNEPDEREIDLIRAMVERGQVVGQALKLIERRTGLERIEFLSIRRSNSGALSADEIALLNHGSVVAVESERGTLGHLATDKDDSQSILEPWGDWLAQWLLLDQQTEELEQMAWTDHLTGAGNRRALERVLESALARAHREDHAVTVMCFDIDDFKQYNDRFGHEAGDNVLCETVQLLNSAIRSGDHVFRVGGDEFVVVFADPSGPKGSSAPPLESIEVIAKRFQEQVSRHPFPQIGEDAPGRLSISAGLVTYPVDGQTTRELLSKADKLALRSKRSGKNVITFGPSRDETDEPA